MRRNATRLLAVLALATAMVVGACEGRQDETGEMAEAIEEREDADLSADADRPVGEIEEPEGTRTLLEPRGQSGVSGTVTARRLDGTVKVEVSLEKADPGARYVAHLHRGTCGEGEGRVAPLEPFVHEPDGATRSETSIDAAKIESDVPHFVQIHGSEHAVAACGSLPDVLSETAPGPDSTS